MSHSHATQNRTFGQVPGSGPPGQRQGVESGRWQMYRATMQDPKLSPVAQLEEPASVVSEVARFVGVCLLGFGVVAALTTVAVVLFLSFAAP